MRATAFVAMLLAFAPLTSGCTKLGLFRRAESSRAPVGPRVGSPAPDLEGEDFEGKHFKLSDYRGKVVMVTFWASWCKPCRELIPHERAMAERYKNSSFVVVGVNYDNDPERARRVIATDCVTWRNMQTSGDDHPIKTLWPVGALPSTYLIDPQGVIRHVKEGGAIPDAEVEKLLPKRGPAR